MHAHPRAIPGARLLPRGGHVTQAPYRMHPLSRSDFASYRRISFAPLKTGRSLFALLALLAAAGLGNAQEAPPPPVLASNDEPITLDPLKVTASGTTGYGAQLSSSSSRLNLRYVDVPQTVSVVTSEFLKDAFIFDSHDFVKFVNNVYPRTNSHQVETYYIRGLITTNSYVDGMLSTFPINRDAALYDRIEYVKGPASAAMGRGEAGGLVNFVSKRPTRRPGNRFDVILGTDNFYRAEFDHEGIITQDGKISYRVPVYYEDGDNPRGGNLLALKKYGIGPSLLWDISPQTQLSLTGAITHFQGLGNVGEMWWSNVNVYRSQLELGQLVGSAWNPTIGHALVPKDRIFGFPGQGRKTDAREFSAILTHRFTDWLSYRQGVRYDDFDEDTKRFGLSTTVTTNPARAGDFLLGITFVNQPRTREAWRVQGDLLFEGQAGNTSHQVLLGYDLFDNSTTDKQGLRGGLSQSMYFPDYSYPAGFDPNTYVTTFTTDNSAKGEGLGYYGQYSGEFFNKKLAVMFGWRKDETQTVTRNHRNNTVTDSGKVKTDVPRYSISYKPTENLSLYYVHSEQADPSRTVARFSGFLPGPGAVVPPPSDPRYNELLTAQLTAELDEIGVKALLFDQRVTATFAAFKIQRNGNIANEFLVEPSTNGVGSVNFNRFFAVNGEYVQGFEFEVFGQPTRNLTLVAGFATMSGEKPNSAGKFAAVEALIDSMSMNVRYDFRDAKRNGFEVTAGGKFFFKGWVMNPGNTVTFNADQYFIDAGAAYYWGGGKFNARLRVNNITDQLVYLTPNSQWGLRRVYLSVGGQF